MIFLKNLNYEYKNIHRIIKFYEHRVDDVLMGHWIEGMNKWGEYIEEWVINHKDPEPIKWKVYFNDGYNEEHKEPMQEL